MPIFKIGGEKQSRKYVDLLKEASSKYANWQPSKPIHVGDYGELNRQTGEFEAEGNVYKEAIFADVVAGLEPEVNEPINEYTLCSKDATVTSPRASLDVDALGVASVAFAGHWTIGKKRAAVLVMSRPCITVMPGALVKKLSTVPFLKETRKSVVTEVFTCPAYAYYMSTTNEEMLSLQLRAKHPIAAVPGVEASASAGLQWYHDHAGGVYQDACHPDDKYQFTPLFHLKKSPKWTLYREDPEVAGAPLTEEDHEFIDTVQTWNILDEDGEEFQDNIPESDSDLDIDMSD